jgi:nitrite reductase/ring-hydroxylating ferredoxin subunit
MQSDAMDATQWIAGPTLTELADQATYSLDHGADGILLVRFADQVTAFRNACLHQSLPIHAGYLDGDGVLICPWHNWCYQVSNGECLTAPGAYLDKYPVRVEDGRVWVLPVAEN